MTTRFPSCDSPHVEQEKRLPPEQHPSSDLRLSRGHSIPLLSAIHHLHAVATLRGQLSTFGRPRNDQQPAHLPCTVLLQVSDTTGMSLSSASPLSAPPGAQFHSNLSDLVAFPHLMFRARLLTAAAQRSSSAEISRYFAGLALWDRMIDNYSTTSIHLRTSRLQCQCQLRQGAIL